MNYIYFATFDIQAESGAQPIFEIFGWPVNDTIFIGWIISLGLVLFSIVVTRNLALRPGRLQNAIELLLEYIIDTTEGLLPGGGKKFLPFIGTIALYIGISNLVGVLPLAKNPTADLNTTVAFGLTVFLVSQGYGMQQKGLWRYIKGFAEPVFFLLPINIIGELAKPISHSFRLFGNIFGGSVIIALAAFFVPGFIPVPFMAWFDIFIGLVQALIFTMLAIAYISVASE